MPTGTDLRRQYLNEIDESASKVLALPSSCYRDPAFFELELEHVLRPGWHPILRGDSLPDIGDYRAVDLFGEPLVIVRSDDQRLRVFSNVCRHRAHTVATGTGNAKSLVCPYHRWTYGLDGALRGAPLMDDRTDFDRAQCGLPELRTELWQGFLMVNLSPETQLGNESQSGSVSEMLVGLDKRLESHDLASMVTLGVLEFDSPWNWKIMADNFMESYHHLGIHSDNLQQTNPAKNTYPVKTNGAYSLLENPGANDAPAFIVAQIFPSFLLAVVDGGPFASWYEMNIDRHDHIHLRIHAIAPPEIKAAPGATEALVENLNTIHLQDIPACEAVQRGIASQLWQPGPLSHREGCLSVFHRYLSERLRLPDRH